MGRLSWCSNSASRYAQQVLDKAARSVQMLATDFRGRVAQLESEAVVVDFLLHFYRKGSKPFQSLSALPEEQAHAIMSGLYVEGSVFWERFKNPREYLCLRKRVEHNLKAGFTAKGGIPKSDYPIYLVLGRPKWTETAADSTTLATTDEIVVPLSMLHHKDVSFTYPDSMVSALMAGERNPEYYEPDYHGKVFTMSEIAQIIEEKGLPGAGWETKMPAQYAHYIEAQVWNQEVLFDYVAHRNQ
jgi:hypothetical protein